MIPLYMVAMRMGLQDTYAGLILPFWPMPSECFDAPVSDHFPR